MNETMKALLTDPNIRTTDDAEQLCVRQANNDLEGWY